MLILSPAGANSFRLTVYERSLFFHRYRVSEEQIIPGRDPFNMAVSDLFHVFAVDVIDGRIVIYTKTMRRRFGPLVFG